MSKSLRFSPYVCPECQSLVMNFETVYGVDICGLCETPLIEYKAIPAAELASLTQLAEKLERIAKAAKAVSDNLSKTEILDIDEKEYNIWSIVGDAEKDELAAALKGDA